MKTEPTLPEKTTAMEKAIRMAKEVHEPMAWRPNPMSTIDNSPTQITSPDPKIIIKTAKQIYDWLTA